MSLSIPKPCHSLGPNRDAAKPSKEWNTETALPTTAVVEVNHPSQVFIAEPKGQSVESQYREFIQQQIRLDGILSKANETYIELNKIFTAVVGTAAILSGRNLTRDDFEFDILRSPEPNAYIYHGDGFKPHVFITTSLLELLKDHLDDVRTSHLAWLLGHELKHYLEGHYTVEHQPLTYRSGDDPLPYREVGDIAIKHSTESFFLGRIFTREQEFICDDFGFEILNSLGLPFSAGTDVLKVLAALHNANESERQLTRTEQEYSITSWFLKSIITTHPATEDRVFHAQGKIRNIQISKYGTAPNCVERPSQDSSITLIGTNLTLEQQALQRLAGVINKGGRGNAFADVRHIADDLAANFQSDKDGCLQALRTLLILAPAYLAVREQVAPRQPFATVASNKLDDSAKIAVSAFEQRVAPIREYISSHISTLSSPSDLPGQVEKWITSELPYSTDAIQKKQLERLIDSIEAEEVSDLIDAVMKHGKRPINWTAGASEFFDELARVPTRLKEHSRLFGKIAANHGLDLRGELIVCLIREGLLERIETEAALLDIVCQIEQSLPPEALTVVSQALADGVAQWIEIYGIDLDATKLAAFLSSVQARRSLQDNEVDQINVGIYLQQATKQADGALTGQLEWLNRALPKSKSRDLIICRLIEHHSNWFENHGLAKKTPSKHPWQDFSHLDSATRAQKELFVCALLSAAEYFDLSWLRATVVNGAIFDGAGELSNGQTITIPSIQKREHELGFSPILCDFSLNTGLVLATQCDPAANEIRFYFRSLLEIFTAPHFTPFPTAQPSKLLGKALPIILYAMEQDRNEYLLLTARGILNLNDPLVDLEAVSALGPSTQVLGLLGVAQIDPYTLDGFAELLAHFPKGERRDYLILYGIALSTQLHAINIRLEFLNTFSASANGLIDRSQLSSFSGAFSQYQSHLNTLANVTRKSHNDIALNERQRYQLIKRAMEDIYGWKPIEGIDSRAPLKSTSPFLENCKRCIALLNLEQRGQDNAKVVVPLDRIRRLEEVRKVYNSYTSYIKLKCGVASNAAEAVELSHHFAELRSIAAEVGRILLGFDVCVYSAASTGAESAATAEPGINEAQAEGELAEIAAIIPFPCEQRDRFLISLLNRGESTPEINKPELYRANWVRELYDLMTSSHAKFDLGRKIYWAKLSTHAPRELEFESHLSELCHLHPPGSVSRELALKEFVDRFNGEGAVRTWQERDTLEKRLRSDQEGLKRQTDYLLRQGAFSLVLEGLRSIDVPAKERVDTLLWAVGIGRKSHLVECIELLEGKQSVDLKDHANRLTDGEKRELVRMLLAGPNGLLSSNDKRARKEFLDTLFFTVFNEGDEGKGANYLAFKATFDCMLFHMSPERASEFLGNFLVSYLEGSDFNAQVKIFFESFDFIGIKTAQYLVSATSLISGTLRDTLMDLTSRVEGPSKLSVFDIAEEILGPHARSIIHSIGERVGGGSLMSFYKVTLWNEDKTKPGRAGVVGVLRPDIVFKMPEDLKLVSTIIQTMHEAPEIFGGEHVNRDLMDNLAWQSLVETDLERTVRLQKLMRADLKDCESVAIPEIWEDQEISLSDGSTTRVKLSQGPLIFMDFAAGTTLDLYLKQFEVTDASSTRVLNSEGRSKLQAIATKVAEVFLHQIAVTGRVHCDLHPGNILIDDSNGTLAVKLLDVGLSTELSPGLQNACSKLLRLIVGSTANSRAEEFIRKFWYGTGRIEQKQELAWIGEIVEIIQSASGEHWSDQQKARAVQSMSALLTNKSRTLQERMSDLSATFSELGISLPREIFYIIRAVSIANHLWAYVDWRSLQSSLARLGKQEAPLTLPSINIEAAVRQIALVHNRITLSNFDESLIRTSLKQANSAEDPFERALKVKDLAMALAGDVESKSRELLKALSEDEALRRALGLERFVEQVRTIFSEMRLSHSQPDAEARAALEGTIQPNRRASFGEIAYIERMGSRIRVWKGILHTGTIVRVNHSKKGWQYYVVEAPDPTDIHRNDQALLRPLESPSFEEARTLTDTNEQLQELVFFGKRSDFEGISFGIPPKADLAKRRKRSDLSNSKIIRFAAAHECAFEDTVIGAQSRKSFDIYREDALEWLLELLEVESRPLEVINLGKMMDDSSCKIEVFRKRKWEPIEVLLKNEGETREQFYDRLGQERMRLGMQ